MNRLLSLMFSIGVLLPRLCAEVSPGEILIAEMNCAACHATSPEMAARLFSRAAPRLGKDGVRVTAQWIREFLADPQKTQPGTLMPDMLHGIPEEKKGEAIEALTHFLVSIQPAGGTPVAGGGPALIENGRKLYHAVGCVQCHAPEVLPASRAKDDPAISELIALQQASVPMGKLADRFTLPALKEFLLDPLKSRPSGRMPAMRLTDGEATAIATYLLRGQARPDDGKFEVNTEKMRVGADWFVTLRCAECHGDAAAGIAVAARPPPARQFEMMHPRQPSGCLSSRPKVDAAKFELTDRQRTVILAALQNQDILSVPLTDEQQVRRTMTVLNCYACHSRDRRGGADGLRRDYFTTLDRADLGDEARIPPTLTGIGARLDPARLRDALFIGAGTRPFMATRMPVYGEVNVKHLLPLLVETAK